MGSLGNPNSTPISDNLTQVAGSSVATAASGIAKVGMTDSSGTGITSTANGGKQGLDVNLNSAQNITIQSQPAYADNSASPGAITASGQSVSLTVKQYTTVMVEIYGTYAGGATLQFEQASASASGVYYPVFSQSITSTFAQAPTSSISPSANQSFMVQLTLGASVTFRVRCSSWASPSGTINVFLSETTDNLQYGQSIGINNTVTANATLSAETTKVIGTVRTADGSGNLLTSTGNALDVNVKTNAATNQSVNLAQVGGSSTATGHGTAATSLRVELPTDGTGTVGLNAGSNLVGDVGIRASSSGGWSVYFANAVKSTVTVSGSAGKFAGENLINTDSAPVYLQCFDTTGAVTLGTTTPTFVLPFPANATAANGIATRSMSCVGASLSNGLKAAATTTATGSSTSTNGLTGTIFYK